MSVHRRVERALYETNDGFGGIWSRTNVATGRGFFSNGRQEQTG